MAEGVKAIGNFRNHSEFLHKIFMSLKNLTHKAFARRYIAVRLQIPSAHYMPASLFNQRLYAFKQLGLIFLHARRTTLSTPMASSMLEKR